MGCVVAWHGESVQNFTRKLWDLQNRHPGDRHRLFTGVADALAATAVLYPGSFVDVAASFVFDDVTYCDNDDRAQRFFDDAAGLDELIAEHRKSPARWRFLHADYTTDLAVADESIDLLVSLYAGFVSDACTRYLRSGGCSPIRATATWPRQPSTTDTSCGRSSSIARACIECARRTWTATSCRSTDLRRAGSRCLQQVGASPTRRPPFAYLFRKG